MSKLSFKIAYPIIIAGLFIMVSFVAINYNNLNVGFYLIFLFLVIFVFFFGLAIGQKLTLPFKKLLKRADDLSRGELETRFYSENKDEIGQLSNVFNKIANKLEESNLENEKIKKLVGIKVEVETRVLRETINALEQKVQNRTLEMQKMAGDSEKFSKAKDTELNGLKSQITELKEKLEKHSVKSNKISN